MTEAHPGPGGGTDRAQAILAALTAALEGRFALERPLGVGGMANVYRATDLRHDRTVAVKVLQPELVHQFGAERFVREIRIISHLNHPNIIGLIDSGLTAPGELPALPYYVMEFVEGESLRERILREGPLPLQDTIRIASEVADALHFAHERGVVHRDVKPANILLQAGHAVVGDFGVARTQSVQGITDSSGGFAIGTPAYMSPEQWDGMPADARSDTYSLGCVVYEMLCGVPPFDGPSAQVIAARHRTQPMPPVRTVRPSLPVAVEQAVERALAKQPADRFQSVMEFRDHLSEAVSTPAPTPVGRPRTSRRYLLPLLIMVAAVAGWLLLRPRAPAPLTALAVLEFEDQSTAGELAMVARSLTSELTAALGQVDELVVPSAARVASLRDRSFGEVVSALGVGTVVQGSLVGSAGSAEIRYQLVDGQSGVGYAYHTLQPADRVTPEDLQRVVEWMTRVIRRSVGEELDQQAQRALIGSVEAREATRRAERLRAHAADLVGRRDPGGARFMLREADSLLAIAETRETRSPLPPIRRAWVSYHLSFLFEADTGGAARSFRDGLGHAEAALRRAPESAEALEVRGALRHLYVVRFPALADSLLPLAEADFRQALARRGTLSRAWLGLGQVLQRQGQMEEAAEAIRRAETYDAFLLASRPISVVLFQLVLEQGNRDLAERLCEDGLHHFPGDPAFVECRLRILGHFGRTRTEADQAWRELIRIRALSDTSRTLGSSAAFRHTMVALVLARAGLADSALRLVDRLEADAAPGATLYRVYVQAALGRTPEAVTALGQVLETAPGLRATLAGFPLLAPLRGDSGFRRLMTP